MTDAKIEASAARVHIMLDRDLRERLRLRAKLGDQPIRIGPGVQQEALIPGGDTRASKGSMLKIRGLKSSRRIEAQDFCPPP